MKFHLEHACVSKQISRIQLRKAWVLFVVKSLVFELHFYIRRQAMLATLEDADQAGPGQTCYKEFNFLKENGIVGYYFTVFIKFSKVVLLFSYILKTCSFFLSFSIFPSRSSVFRDPLVCSLILFKIGLSGSVGHLI